MFRKISLIILASFTVTYLAGCKDNTVVESQVSSNSSISDSIHEEFFDANVPGPRESFPDLEFNIYSSSSSGDFYAFTISGISQEDYYTYVDSLNSEVFVHESSYNSDYYHALSSENRDKGDYYSIEIWYREDDSELVVNCGYVEPK